MQYHLTICICDLFVHPVMPNKSGEKQEKNLSKDAGEGSPTVLYTWLCNLSCSTITLVSSLRCFFVPILQDIYLKYLNLVIETKSQFVQVPTNVYQERDAAILKCLTRNAYLLLCSYFDSGWIWTDSVHTSQT